jgi:CubicO group peptidase (beta-lactamase class C family)
MKKQLLLVLALAVQSCSSDTSNPPSYAAAIQEAQDAAYEVARQGGTSVGIALVSRDRVILASGFGAADLNASVPATENTMFPIGSVSKMFAAVAVMQLVDRGLVDLDKPVVQYLPSFRMADPRYQRITVKMLLNHTSGIPGTRYIGAETTIAVRGYAEAVVASLADQRLKADPGSMAVYCNDGFAVADQVVAAVTNMTYADWVKKEIFTPLGMTHSSFSLAPFADGSYAKAYRGGVPMPQEYVNVDAGGGIYSTAADMAAFVRMFLNRGSVGGVQVLSTKSVDRMAEDQTVGTFNPVPWKGMTYGLGWDSVAEAGLGQAGTKGWTKNGGTFFYGAQLLVAPDEGLAAVALGPAGGGYAPLAITQRVLTRALVETGRLASFPKPLPPQAAAVASVPDGLLGSVAGIYASYDHVFQLRAEADGSLTLLTLRADGFAPTYAGFRYRADGWFMADAAPLLSLSVVSGGANQYLAARSSFGDKSYLDTMAYAQRVTGRGAALSSAWSGRLGKQWLVVNEHPDALPFMVGEDPRFGLMTLPDLTGVLLALPALPPMNMGWQAQVLDGSVSAQTASMMLLIPGLYGNDLNDLDVVVRGGEEWLRWGGAFHRPLETVQVLAAGTSSSVAIGPEGFAEWRSVQRGTAPVSISISGARAWRLYDATFQTLGSGGAAVQPVVADGQGLAYLMLFGEAGGNVTVAVQ